MIEYHLEQILPNGKTVTVYTNGSLKKVTDYFEYFCSLHKEKKYVVIKREIIDSVIAESNDFRQQLMSFV
jgi:hypothetical protein